MKAVVVMHLGNLNGGGGMGMVEVISVYKKQRELPFKMFILGPWV